MTDTACVQILELLIDYASLDYGDAIDTLCRDLGAKRYVNTIQPELGMAVRSCPLSPALIFP